MKITLEKIEKIPSLSVSAQKIVAICNDVNSTQSDLVRIIKYDPVLTGKIMGLINSAYFSLPTYVQSLNRAIILLGLNTVKNLALSTALIESLGKNKKNKFLKQELLWEHMLAVGIISKLLAHSQNIEKKLVEQYFISGLLHDIGDMILFIFYTEELQIAYQNSKENGQSLNYNFKELHNITPNEIGGQVAEKWNLPLEFKEAIQFSREPKSGHSDIIKTVHLADRIARHLKIGFVCDTNNTSILSQDLAKIHFDKTIYKDLPEFILEEMNKARIFIQ